MATDPTYEVPSPPVQATSGAHPQPVLGDQLSQSHYQTYCMPQQDAATQEIAVVALNDQPATISGKYSLNQASSQNATQAADPQLGEVLGVELSSFDFDGLEDVISWTPSFSNHKS